MLKRRYYIRTTSCNTWRTTHAFWYILITQL